MRSVFYFLLIFLFIGCSSTEEQGSDKPGDSHRISYNLNGKVFNITPGQKYNLSEYQVSRHVFETLFDDGNANSKIIGQILIDSLGTHKILRFNPNLRFANGESINQEIVKDWFGRLDIPRDLVVLEGMSLKIPVDRYESAVLALEDPTSAFFLKTEEFPLGTGPWQVAAWNEDISLLLRRNQYHPQQGNVQEIIFRFVENKSVEIEEFKNGELDIIELSPADRITFSKKLALDDYSNFRAIPNKNTKSVIAQIETKDSLDAYFINRSFENASGIYRFNQFEEPIIFPDLPDREQVTQLIVSGDSTIFTQSIIDSLSLHFQIIAPKEEKEGLAGIKLYTIDHLADEDVLEIWKNRFYTNKTSVTQNTYLTVLNSWSGLLVYQYYIDDIDYFNDTIYNLGSINVKQPEVIE